MRKCKKKKKTRKKMESDPHERTTIPKMGVSSITFRDKKISYTIAQPTFMKLPKERAENLVATF